VKAPQRRRKPSAPAKPDADLVFAWERFPEFAGECSPLFLRHWKEIALNQDTVPLDPDWDRYYAQALAGVLQTLTARVDGKLVGYVFALAGPHLHYNSTLFAVTDMFWLDPLYRRGWGGYKMLNAFVQGLKETGVKVCFISEKVHFKNARTKGVSTLLKRLGFKPTDLTWSLKLGD